VGLVLGAFLGVLSLATLSKIEKGYNYVVTFALMLSIYAVTELLAGSGAIAVLVFGVVFGNETAIRRLLRFGLGVRHFTSKSVQVEISFFIRTFFLVFLGAIVDLGSVTNLLYALGLIALLYAIRYAAIRVVVTGSPLSKYSSVLSAMNPRGLATAVLATYPIIAVQDALRLQADARLSSVQAQLSSLPEITFYIIVLSVLLTSILVPLAARKTAAQKPQEEKERKKTSTSS
jgi:cell volume regulation protein A